jgi:hypothetical protein
MNGLPLWLGGILVWFALGLIVGLRVSRAFREQREEDEARRIASRYALPANWQEMDSYGSWLDACAEMRRRKAGGA